MSASESSQTALNRAKRLQSPLENGPEAPEFKAGCPLEQYRAGSTPGFELFRPSLEMYPETTTAEQLLSIAGVLELEIVVGPKGLSTPKGASVSEW